MKNLNRILFFVLLVEVSMLYVQSSFALFSDTSASSANTFSAALEFSGPTGISGPTGSSGPTGPSGIASDLVINEVYYDVDSSHTLINEGNSEWVELYNPTNFSINLDGWTIEDNNNIDTLSSSISPGSFILLIATDSASFQSKWTVPLGTNIQTVTGNIGGNGLSNAGDFLILKNNNVEVDRMSWGTNISGFITGCTVNCPDVGVGHSLERNPDGFDTGDAGDFIDTNPPTPGT